MKINLLLTLSIVIAIVLNIYNYDYFLYWLSFTWYIASVIIIYGGIKFSIRYGFIQLNIKKIILALKSKSKNDISPLNSLSVSLAAKVGVGSLSGVALAIYYGGIGSFFWICFVSLIISINTYVECILGMKYRHKIGNNYVGGPSYYIKYCLNNKYLSYLYGILIIISYSGLFLSIQSNTIASTVRYFNVDTNYIVIVLFVSVLFIIIKGIKSITKVNSILVPLMLIFYLSLGLYVLLVNINTIPVIIVNIFKEAFNIKRIIPVFLIGIQRGIFITESSIGTSAISASSCDNDSTKQGLLEVLGIHITVFLVCLTTFIIITTSNYNLISFQNMNGIEIIIYAFKYHFGSNGQIILAIITILFAFSTIISSYYFGESNINLFSSKNIIKTIFKICFMIIIVISCYVKSNILWNLTDYLIAILAIINVSSMLKIIFIKAT